MLVAFTKARQGNLDPQQAALLKLMVKEIERDG